MILSNIPISDEQIADFCRRHHVLRMAFFGSVLREDFGPQSDVDVLIEFEPGHVPGLRVYDIEQELSRLCGGRRIDMANPKYLNRWLKDEILSTAELVHGEW